MSVLADVETNGLANQKAVLSAKSGVIKIYKGSTIEIPTGTKITIYINEENDPTSDVIPQEVITREDLQVIANAEGSVRDVFKYESRL